MPSLPVRSSRTQVFVSSIRHVANALMLALLLTSAAVGQVRPIDPGISLPINPGGGGGGPGGGGGGPGIGIPINPIGPINPINPGGGVVPTGPRIVTDAGMLAGKSSQAAIVFPTQPTSTGTTVTTYQWTVSGGRITSNPTIQTITFTADNAGTVALNAVITVNGASQSTSAEVTVLSPLAAGAMTAPATARTNANPLTATVPAAQNADRTFRWSLAGTGAAIASGQGTNRITLRPGAPGLLEVMCDVTLQRLATVTLRSFVVVTGEGANTTLTINGGSGGGTYPAGSRVDIFADPPSAGQVFNRWVGNTAILGNAALATSSPHVVVTVPTTPSTLTATYRDVPEWTPIVVNNFNPIAQSSPNGTTLSYHLPPSARGVVFLLHDSGGAAAGWFTRPEQLTLARDLVAAGIGVAALSSVNRVTSTWSTLASLATNPDVATLAAARDRFVRDGLISATTPLFLLGTGAAGDAAAQYAHLLATTSPTRPVKGAVLYCATGGTSAAMTSRVPKFFALAAHDENLGVAGNADARENAQLLTGRGIATAVINNTASPVPAGRLRILGLASPSFNSSDAQAIWSALKTAALLDANDYPKSIPTVDAVRAALPATYQSRAADVQSQLAVAFAGPELFSDANARVINFLNARLNDAPSPAPGRLVNLSTRTRIAYLGDTFTLGFTLAGTQRATLLIRGVGPALSRFGVTDALPALRLEVNRGTTLLTSNEGWDRTADPANLISASTSAGAFALPRGSLDTAVLLTLDPGAYTATIKSINGAVGDVLAEVYDVSRNGTRLTNLSALAKIGADGEVLIPGIVVAGNNPRTVVVRAVGPGLADVGLPGNTLLQDPRLAIVNGAGQMLANNNNWNQGDAATDATTLNAVFSAVGAFPLRATNGDAALVSALAPGTYTLQAAATPLVALPGGTLTASATGTVLVEVYELP
jgi:hypothetical protein